MRSTARLHTLLVVLGGRAFHWQHKTVAARLEWAENARARFPDLANYSAEQLLMLRQFAQHVVELTDQCADLEVTIANAQASLQSLRTQRAEAIARLDEYHRQMHRTNAVQEQGNASTR